MQIITKYDIGEFVKFKRIIVFQGKKPNEEEIHVGIVHKVLIQDEKKEVKKKQEDPEKDPKEKGKKKPEKPQWVVVRTVSYLMKSSINNWIPEDQILCVLIPTPVPMDRRPGAVPSE
jgi:hypothetical protein